MIILFAALALQAAEPAAGAVRASATLTVEDAVAVSSVAPIRLRDGRVDSPVVIGVAGDPGRAYRLQLQATVSDGAGHTRVVSAAAGEIGPSDIASTGIAGGDEVRIFGATTLLRAGPEGRAVLPVRIVYE